ncbi:DUF2892 domain-containing protein [Bradyrhizobium sp. NAS96.2]|nr:DUF2892 domain-containing protein [Bradyrhizobium sp. NAS96.2]
MARNVGRIDQYVRIIIGLAVLIATAFFSYCPLYLLLGINTVHRSSAV